MCQQNERIPVNGIVFANWVEPNVGERQCTSVVGCGCFSSSSATINDLLAVCWQLDMNQCTALVPPRLKMLIHGRFRPYAWGLFKPRAQCRTRVSAVWLRTVQASCCRSRISAVWLRTVQASCSVSDPNFGRMTENYSSLVLSVGPEFRPYDWKLSKPRAVRPAVLNVLCTNRHSRWNWRVKAIRAMSTYSTFISPLVTPGLSFTSIQTGGCSLAGRCSSSVWQSINKQTPEEGSCAENLGFFKANLFFFFDFLRYI